MQLTRRLAVAVLALCAAVAVVAQPTRYVTDEFRINLRSGAGNQFRILELVTTGTALQLLDSQNGWSQVRTPDGTTGWVPSQYLSTQPAAADRLGRMEEQLNEARSRVETLESTLSEVRGELETARQRIRELTGRRDTLNQKLDEARKGLELAEENKALKKQVIDLQRRIQDLESETERLSDRNRQDWFMVGAGVVVLGMLIGIAVTRIRWRKRSSWSQL